jgi:hypothetical protein
MRRGHWVFLGAIWLVLIAAGLKVLADYQSTPGRRADPPAAWPGESLITRIPGRATLVMFAHPQCPCTRASMTELERLLARVPGKMRVTVVFFQPAGVMKDWLDTDTWKHASRIPGVTTVVDEAGKEAERFAAVTSGQVALYDENGLLVFNGGITAGRGQVGTNTGAQQIERLVAGESAERNESLVFGCSLKELSDRTLQWAAP